PAVDHYACGSNFVDRAWAGGRRGNAPGTNAAGRRLCPVVQYSDGECERTGPDEEGGCAVKESEQDHEEGHGHGEGHHAHDHEHKYRKQIVNRLSRIEGHVRSVKMMTAGGRDC